MLFSHLRQPFLYRAPYAEGISESGAHSSLGDLRACSQGVGCANLRRRRIPGEVDVFRINRF